MIGLLLTSIRIKLCKGYLVLPRSTRGTVDLSKSGFHHQGGSFKVNVDVAFHVDSFVAGLGVIVRDHLGRVILSKACPWPCVSGMDMAELLVVREDIRLA